jgi:cytochrome c oxidase subunit 1
MRQTQRPVARLLPIWWVVAGAALMVLGQASRLMLANVGVEYGLHDGSYVVANWHYTLSLAVAFGIFAASYALFRRVIGVDYRGSLGFTHLALTVLGMTLILGSTIAFVVNAMPKRYLDYPESSATAAWTTNLGYLLTLVGLVVFVAAIVDGLWRRRRRAA